MGRWVTIRGRRVYIPDKGEENPYSKEFKKKLDTQNAILGTNTRPEDTVEYKKAEIDRQLQKNHPDWYPNSNYETAKYEVSKGMIKENLEAIQRKKEGLARAEKAGDKLAAAGLRQDIESLKKQNSAAHNTIRDQINKDFDLKEKQIADNKKQVEVLNEKKIWTSKDRLERARNNISKAEAERDELKSKYTKKYGSDPKEWMKYGEEGKQAYYEYKDAQENYKDWQRQLKKEQKKVTQVADNKKQTEVNRSWFAERRDSEMKESAKQSAITRSNAAKNKKSGFASSLTAESIKSAGGHMKVGSLSIEIGKLYNKKTDSYSGPFGKMTTVWGVDANGNRIDKTFRSPEAAIEFLKKHSKQ